MKVSWKSYVGFLRFWDLGTCEGPLDNHAVMRLVTCPASRTPYILKDEMTRKNRALYPYTMNPYMVYEP